MLESLQTGVFDYEKLKPEEMQARGILGRLVGVMADTVNPTRNGRAYSKKLWENVFANPIMQERIENKCCFGELGHPTDREETDMSKIAICMDGLPKVDPDGKLRAVFNILDTPNGRILKTLCDYGCNIGISSRGSGDLVTDFDGNESVDPDTYNCEGWDAVLIPAVKEARLQYVTESLEKKRYNKTLRKRLQEAVDKETDENKKAMTEALHTFGIRLNEDVWDEIENDSTEPEAGPEPNQEFVDKQENIDDTPIDDASDDISIGDIDEDDSLADDLEEEPVDDDFSDMDDIPLDDVLEEPKPASIEYKGAKIVKDEDSGKFVCEIDGEPYVFNSEKNAKLWIDMNSEQVVEDRVEKDLDKALKDPDEETFEETKEDALEESLNEEQIGRDTVKDAKSESEVLEPKTDEKEPEEDDKDKIVIKFNEAYGNSTDDAVIGQFISDCIEKLKESDGRTDIELELPDTLDTDMFWMDLNTEAREHGIYLSMQEREEIDDFVYLYFYISKTDDFLDNFDDQLASTSDSIEDTIERRQDRKEKAWDLEEREAKEIAEREEANKSDWERLNSTEQMAVESVLQHIEYNGLTDSLEDLVSQACNMYNEANAFDEYADEPFANEEADEDVVLKYIKNHSNLNESLNKLNLSSLKYSEDKLNEAVNDGAEMNELQETLKNNFELEKQIRLLQEKLSASHAREKSLKEEVESYKAKISKLSEVSKKNKALTEKLNTVEASKDKLNESLEKVKSLTEELNSVKKDNSSVKAELEKMNEAYAELDKDLSQVRDQYGKRFERQNQLLEKYQKITKNSVDRYINLQANNLGVKTSEIRNKLPEKFSFSDIDLVCEDLRNYKLNVSKLPFSTHQLNENINMRVNNLSPGLIPTNETDEINDYDLKLMEMFK